MLIVGARLALPQVIEYCTWHVKADSDGTSEDARNDWNQKFVDVDQGTLFHLILVRSLGPL